MKKRISTLSRSDFPPIDDAEWAFARDEYITESSIGARPRRLSYDDLEDESEGNTHYNLKKTAHRTLQEMGYSTYDGGVGFKGLHGFCDGAAKRNNDFVLFECLSDWSAKDREVLDRKLRFSEFAPLILVARKKHGKFLRFYSSREASGDNIIVGTPSKAQGNWKLRFEPFDHHLVLPVFDSPPEILLKTKRMRSYTEITISNGDENLCVQHVIALNRDISSATRKLVDGFSRINNRQRKKNFDSEYIARCGGKEIARLAHSISNADINIFIRVKNDVTDSLVEMVMKAANDMGISIDAQSAIGRTHQENISRI